MLRWLPWQSSGWYFAFQYRGWGFSPWLGSQNIKTYEWKRSNIVTNSINTLKVIPTRKIFKKSKLFIIWWVFADFNFLKEHKSIKSTSKFNYTCRQFPVLFDHPECIHLFSKHLLYIYSGQILGSKILYSMD